MPTRWQMGKNTPHRNRDHSTHQMGPKGATQVRRVLNLALAWCEWSKMIGFHEPPLTAFIFNEHDFAAVMYLRGRAHVFALRFVCVDRFCVWWLYFGVWCVDFVFGVGVCMDVVSGVCVCLVCVSRSPYEHRL